MQPDGGVLLPLALADEVYRQVYHYREEMPGLCRSVVEAQQRIDEGWWLAWHDQTVALEPEPMPTWKLALWVTGGVLIGAAVGVGVSLGLDQNRVTVVK